MPSDLPSPETDYKFPPAPARAVLDRPTWDAVMGSISERLKGLESQSVELEEVINELRLYGQTRLSTELDPLITDAQARLNQLNEDVAAAQAAVEDLLSGQLSADNVTESATRVFVTPAQRDEIGSLKSRLDALMQGITADRDTLAEIANAIPDKASTEQAVQGSDDSRFMTALKTKQAVLQHAPKPEWRQIGNPTVISTEVALVEMTIPDGYSDILVEFTNLRHDFSSGDFRLTPLFGGVSDGGATISGQLTSGVQYSGAVALLGVNTAETGRLVLIPAAAGLSLRVFPGNFSARQTSDLTAIRIAPQGGDLTGGTIRLYGR